jgi:hypothetical protein
LAAMAAAPALPASATRSDPQSPRRRCTDRAFAARTTTTC